MNSERIEQIDLNMIEAEARRLRAEAFRTAISAGRDRVLAIFRAKTATRARHA